MGLKDITGVFSRYFIVGFFLPAYFTLVALWLTASGGFIPDSLQRHTQATQLLVLGAVALVAGLALSGLNYPITRFFEGYPLMQLQRWRAGRWLPELALSQQRRAYRRLHNCRDDDSRPKAERAGAAWRLDQFFPPNEANLLPTRIGNAIRTFERHSNIRYGLDGVTIWPRIDALLAAEERGLQVDAKVDLYVFLNSALGAAAVGVCLLIDKLAKHPHPLALLPLYLAPFLIAYALYRAAIGPAVRWGDVVRASIDLHRLELYEKLGLRRPTSFSEEQQIAPRLSQMLLYGQRLPDELWGKDASDSHTATPAKEVPS